MQVADPKPTLDASKVILELSGALSRAILGAFEASRRAQEVVSQISISYLQNDELQVADPKPTLDASEVILELSRAILGASARNLGTQKVVFQI